MKALFHFFLAVLLDAAVGFADDESKPKPLKALLITGACCKLVGGI